MTLDRDPFAGFVWLTSRQAAAYVPCIGRDGEVSLKAWYEWKKRHGLIARANGSVAKADLDRELRGRKTPRRMTPAQLANLQKRSA